MKSAVCVAGSVHSGRGEVGLLFGLGMPKNKEH